MCLLDILKLFSKSVPVANQEPIEEPQRKEEEEIKNNEEETMENKNLNSPILKGPSDIKILIDNGHGVRNYTAGKRSPYSNCGELPALSFIEGEWTREIAAGIYDELLERGYDVSLLVPEDEDIPLKTRVERVNKICREVGKNNVILISIHSNAAGNGRSWMSAYGWSAYTTKGQTESDNIAEYLYDAAEKYWNGYKKKIRKDSSDGDRDWEDNFYITKNTSCPAVLTESGFYDNVEDCKYLISSDGKSDVVRIHVEGIIEYLKNKKK